MYEDKLCIWKYMSQQKESTTFKDVTQRHELYRCKYECLGYGQYRSNGLIKNCRHYKPLGGLLVKYSD